MPDCFNLLGDKAYNVISFLLAKRHHQTATQYSYTTSKIINKGDKKKETMVTCKIWILYKASFYSAEIFEFSIGWFFELYRYLFFLNGIFEPSYIFCLETINDKYSIVHFNVEFNSKNSIDSCFPVHSKNNAEELKIDKQY